MIVNMINNNLKTNMCTSGYASYNFVHFIIFARMSITTFENNIHIKYSGILLTIYKYVVIPKQVIILSNSAVPFSWYRDVWKVMVISVIIWFWVSVGSFWVCTFECQTKKVPEMQKRKDNLLGKLFLRDYCNITG